MKLILTRRIWCNIKRILHVRIQFFTFFFFKSITCENCQERNYVINKHSCIRKCGLIKGKKEREYKIELYKNNILLLPISIVATTIKKLKCMNGFISTTHFTYPFPCFYSLLQGSQKGEIYFDFNIVLFEWKCTIFSCRKQIFRCKCL